MLKPLLTARNMKRYWDPDDGVGHKAALGPILAIHDAYTLLELGRHEGHQFRWNWVKEAAVVDALPLVRHMAGRWKALRGVTVKRNLFDRKVLEVTRRLASYLNRNGVTSLYDVARFDQRNYSRVVQRINGAVIDISSLRKTAETQPVLGSKVLHHLFPSVVPAFDAVYIRKGVLETEAFEYFLRDADDWIVYCGSEEAGGPHMLKFHQYFAMCAYAVGTTKKARLNVLRRHFGHAFSEVAPGRMVNDRGSLLWRLDAKIAEYCLVGQAFREGIL